MFQNIRFPKYLDAESIKKKETQFCSLRYFNILKFSYTFVSRDFGKRVYRILKEIRYNQRTLFIHHHTLFPLCNGAR